jgi:hypothetical protein
MVSNPPVVIAHPVSILDTGIIVHAEPEIDFAHILPLVDNGVDGLLEQVVPLARGECDHYPTILWATIFEIVGSVSRKIRPVHTEQQRPQLGRLFAHVASASCRSPHVLVQINEHLHRVSIPLHNVLVEHYVAYRRYKIAGRDL